MQFTLHDAAFKTELQKQHRLVMKVLHTCKVSRLVSAFIVTSHNHTILKYTSLKAVILITILVLSSLMHMTSQQ